MKTREREFVDLGVSTEALERELAKVRHRYFGAKSYWEKQAHQQKDRETRGNIVLAIKGSIDRRNAGYRQQTDLLQQQLAYYEGADRKKRENKIAELRGKMIDGETADSTASLLSRFDPYDQNASAPFFDPEWMFGISEGFDLVIGNPPYVQIQNFSGKPEQARWENQKYAVWAKTGDVYCLFYERGYKLLAEGGSLCYITSNKWMRAAYGKALRSFFLANGRIETFIDFGDSPIFESATTYTNILLWRRVKEPGLAKAYDLSRVYSTEQDLPALIAESEPGEAIFDTEGFVIAAGESAAIKRRIEAVGKPLKGWGININYGIKTGFNEAFIIDQTKYDELVAADQKSAEILRPILRGRDIKRYKAEWAGKYLVATFPSQHIDIEKYPAVREYLKGFGQALEQSGERGCRKKTNNKWFEIQDTIAYWEEFGKEKIIVPSMVNNAAYYHDDQGFFCNDKGSIITGGKIKYLCAVLNSDVIWHYMSQIASTKQGGFVEVKPMYFSQIPIPSISSEAAQPYEILVDCIQFAKTEGLEGEAEILEAVVDLMVFGLYFPEDLRMADCYINDRIAEVVKPFTEADGEDFKTAYIKKLADFCRHDAVVYRGLIQSRNVDVVKTIRGKEKA